MNVFCVRNGLRQIRWESTGLKFSGTRFNSARLGSQLIETIFVDIVTQIARKLSCPDLSANVARITEPRLFYLTRRLSFPRQFCPSDWTQIIPTSGEWKSSPTRNVIANGNSIHIVYLVKSCERR